MRTLRSLFHPLDCHGTSVVSGSARAGTAPRRRAGRGCRAGVSSLASTQSRVSTCQSLSSPGPGPGGHLGAVEREVLGRAQHRVQLDQGAVGDSVVERRRSVRAPEPAPRHHVGAGRDRGRRVDLQQRQVADHDVEQVGGPRRRRAAGRGRRSGAPAARVSSCTPETIRARQDEGRPDHGRPHAGPAQEGRRRPEVTRATTPARWARSTSRPTTCRWRGSALLRAELSAAGHRDRVGVADDHGPEATPGAERRSGPAHDARRGRGRP